MNREQMFPESAVVKLMIEERTKGIYIGGAVVGIIMALLLFGVVASAQDAPEVSSVRDTQYEWLCETEAGVLVSGHTRQDKAFQSCFNQALATGNKHIVRGGTYRVTATGGVVPPTEPPVEPPVVPPTEPPPEPPPDDSMVSFGPVTGIVQYPASIAALKQDSFRWEITFTLNAVGSTQGLASRDQTGKAEAGHLSIWVDSAGLINARHQDIEAGAPDIGLKSTAAVTAGREYLVVVSIDTGNGFGLFVDGSLQASSPLAFGLTGNDLPLVVGGLCTRCTADGLVGPDRPVNGTVYLEIWDQPLALPAPIVGEVMLNWINPTEYENNDPLPAGIPDRISVYELSPRALAATLDGESINYEATNLAGGEHCFVVTAWHLPTESADSNTVCKVVQ